MPIDFALVLHAHQPAGNFDDVIEATYQRSYRPFVEAVAVRNDIRINLHYSGYLLDWIAARHPEHLRLLRDLGDAQRLEMLGGGYFEPILPAIAPADRLEQIARLSGCLRKHFGRAPRGMWLAERVWEPDLPQTLARAGLDYTLLDDFHFLLAGIEQEQLRGCLLTEHQGAVVRIFPCNHDLRLAIPFRPPEESFRYLLDASRTGALLTMGDDMEKFGSWPQTYAHVYAQGWLKSFFDGLEARRGEIHTVRLSDYLDRHPPAGPVYLPSASYPEMMEWALPYRAAARFRQARQDAATAPYRSCIIGAPWRAFLAKYREANLLQKTQQDIGRRLRTWRARHPDGPAESVELEPPAAAVFHQAYDALLAGQANDAYWHGWFGGLYAPHLRNELWRRLIAADRLLESLTGPEPMRRFDLDCDGYEEVELRCSGARLLAAPADGGCIEQIDYRTADANLVNSLQRRPEIYHDDIRGQARVNPASLPGAANAASPEWIDDLRYDRYPRACGRLYVFAAGKSFADFAQLRLEEDAAVAGDAYTILDAVPGRLTLGWSGAGGQVRKEYRLSELVPAATDGDIGQPHVRLSLAFELEGNRFDAGAQVAVEFTFNLLAATMPDRYLSQQDRRIPLDWAGRLEPAPIALIDGWRRLRIGLTAPGAAQWWAQPLFTVSQSESGFERVYQGSAIAAVWPAGSRRLVLDIEVLPEPQ